MNFFCYSLNVENTGCDGEVQKFCNFLVVVICFKISMLYAAILEYKIDRTEQFSRCLVVG